jgi:hypothetical protein
MAASAPAHNSLLKKTHRLRSARPTRFNVLKRTPQLIELRASRLWIFLSRLAGLEAECYGFATAMF